MKKLILIAALTLSSVVVLAQTTNTTVPTFITGHMDIKYDTQVPAVPQPGDKDTYELNINFCDKDLFHGTITDLPLLTASKWGGLGGSQVVQKRSLNYDIACDIINPKNHAQTKNIGSILGRVNIAETGEYHYDIGTLKFTTIASGQGLGLDRRFDGVAYGKPLVRPANWLETMQREAVSITRNVNGKTMTQVLTKYDVMDFRNVVIAAGPVAAYGDTTVNGKMLYDYEKKTWFFKDITIQYPIDSNIKIDRISGDIRWMPDAHRATSGQGEYDFDIRVNEPLPSEATAFSAPAGGDDENAFFQTDPSVCALNGTMTYKDTFKSGTVNPKSDPTGENATTLMSSVDIKLNGNNLTKQQAMILCKMIIFTAVVPMNSD